MSHSVLLGVTHCGRSEVFPGVLSDIPSVECPRFPSFEVSGTGPEDPNPYPETNKIHLTE